MSELVKISIEDHIADVRFNRPEKFNALSFEMIDAMAGAIDRLAGESGVRVVVISGEGKSFCAGLDIENFAALQSGTNKFPDLTRRYQNRISNIYQHIGYGWKELPVPVIAAIHGVAFGGGFQIAMGGGHPLQHARREILAHGNALGLDSGHERFPDHPRFHGD